MHFSDRLAESNPRRTDMPLKLINQAIIKLI